MKTTAQRAKGMNRRHRGESGQAMVEMAVCLPILLLVVLGICDFGWLFYNKLGVENASREGARVAIVSAGDAGVNAQVAETARSACMGSEADTAVTVSITSTDAVVTVTKQVRTLTPLAGIFVSGQTVEIASTTKMRIG